MKASMPMATTAFPSYVEGITTAPLTPDAFVRVTNPLLSG
jgi:hypothetical protein